MKSHETIAIFGANSQIAKGLICNFLNAAGYRLHLHTTSPDKTTKFLQTIEKSCPVHDGYESIARNKYDVIINCVGVGTANKLCGEFSRYFTVTEKYDNLCLDYLQTVNPDALYIDFSSGCVYGRELTEPAQENTVNGIRPNRVSSADYYMLARLNSEAKHRSLPRLRIIDLRVFSYFSRFADLSDGYFMSDLVASIMNHTVLLTDRTDMSRDYIHPQDLFQLIQCCLHSKPLNMALDAISKASVRKTELLAFFAQNFGLQYKQEDTAVSHSATGAKNIYCSSYSSASIVGYCPTYSSFDAVVSEAKHFFYKNTM